MICDMFLTVMCRITYQHAHYYVTRVVGEFCAQAPFS